MQRLPLLIVNSDALKTAWQSKVLQGANKWWIKRSRQYGTSGFHRPEGSYALVPNVSYLPFCAIRNNGCVTTPISKTFCDKDCFLIIHDIKTIAEQKHTCIAYLDQDTFILTVGNSVNSTVLSTDYATYAREGLKGLYTELRNHLEVQAADYKLRAFLINPTVEVLKDQQILSQMVYSFVTQNTACTNLLLENGSTIKRN